MKGIFRLLSFFVTYLLLSLPAPAADLLAVYRQAVDSDPALLGAKHQQAAVEESVWQAWAELLPRASATYQYTDRGQEVLFKNDIGTDSDADFSVQEGSISLTQPVLRYASLVRLGQAKIQVKRGNLNLELARQELLLRVAELYFVLLAERDRVDFANAELQAVQAHFELAQGRFDMGLAPITDLHDAKARLASVQAKVIEAQNRLDDARQAIREVTAELPEDLAPLATDVPLLPPEPADPEAWVDAALKQNLDLEVQRQTLEIAKKEITRQRAAHFPTIEVTGRYSVEKKDDDVAMTADEVKTTDYLASLNVPLLEGGIVLSRTREAVQLKKRAQEELIQATRRVMREARSSYLGLISAISKAQALQQSVVSQVYAVEAKEEGFRAGLYTGLAVLDAERDLYLARQDYAQARYDYILNSLRLKKAAGSLSEADLAQVNALLQSN